MHPLLQGLNPEQARAVETTEGPLLILAGAGSGKTRVLTRRVAWLIEQGVAPWNILAVTFTNKAASEMRERVRTLVGPRGEDVWISTFHSTCVRILRRDIEPLGYNRSFAIWDDDDQGRLIKRILADLKIDAKVHPPNACRSIIDRAKNALKTPDEIARRPGDRMVAIFKEYEERLKKANALDFNDLINKVVELWSTQPDILARWHDRFRYLLVDEYQDTNAAQYKLLRLLAAHHGNLAVVGDDDQSIYSFRGADIRNILDFEKDYPNAAVIKLEQNYRSTANILRAASTLVRNNENRKDKTLRTEAAAGARLQFLYAGDEDDEARLVLTEIRRHLVERRPSDFAIIYRTNAQSRPFERVLTDAGIPFVLVGGKKFYERREVRDVLAYIKLLLNPADDMSLLRILNVPARGLGDKAVETLLGTATVSGGSVLEAVQTHAQTAGRMGNALAGFLEILRGLWDAAQQLEPGAFVLHVARATGYLGELEKEATEESIGRIANIEELATAVDTGPVDPGATPVERLVAFLDRASLSAQSDSLPDAESGAVTLLTVHLAKGLEFPVVFVVGMNEGTFPLMRSERETDREEERRLAYVAITRARDHLYCTAVRERWMSGGEGGPQRTLREVVPSSFLAEIPRELFEKPPPGRYGLDASRYQAPMRDPATTYARARSAWESPAPRSTSTGSGAGETHRSPGFGPPPSRPRVVAAAVPGDRRRMKPESPEAFKEGIDVFHPLLGVGTVQKCEGTRGSLKLTIHFPDHGTKTVFAASAGMDILLP